MKKALVVVTGHSQLGSTGKKTGWYLPEVTHVYYPLIEAGFSVDFASIKGGAPQIDQSSLSLDDPLNKKFVEDKSTFQRLESTISLKDVSSKEYQVIYFAGGHGTMWDFPHSSDLDRVTAEIYENGGIVAAVCHGPAALVNVKLTNGEYLVAGKDVNSFTDSEEQAVGLTAVVPFLLESKLRERGGNFQSGANWENKVVVSERLVTGQNPQSARSVGEAIVNVAKNIFNKGA